MAALLTTLIALATLTFGAVYPWAYLPLFAAAALIGLAGLGRGGIPPNLRPLGAALLLLWLLAAAQLVPLPRSIVDVLSPSTAALSSSYRVLPSAAERLPLSIDPPRTQIAVLALGALIVYLLGLPALLEPQCLRAFPRLLAVFAVPLALFAIYTRQLHSGLIYGFWQPLDGGPDQAGPFINRNHFAGWMLMVACLMVGWLCGRIERTFSVSTGRRNRTIAGMLSEDAGHVFLMTTAVALAVISIFWVVSRSAITSLGVVIGLFAWLVLRRHRFGRVHRLVVLATLGGVLLGGVAWRGLDVLVRWFLDERSLLSRLDAWRDGWDVVRDFPFFGTGLNTYSPAMLFYQTRNPDFHMAQAHNDYLQLLAEGGVWIVVPAAIAALLLARAARRNVKAARAEARGYWIRAGAGVGLVAVALQETVEFSLQIPANALLFCTMAAIALAPVSAGTVGAPGVRDNIHGQKHAADVSLP